MLKTYGVGLPPPDAFPLRTGRWRGKDLLGFFLRMKISIRELKMHLLIHLFEKASGVHQDAGPSSGAERVTSPG